MRQRASFPNLTGRALVVTVRAGVDIAEQPHDGLAAFCRTETALRATLAATHQPRENDALRGDLAMPKTRMPESGWMDYAATADYLDTSRRTLERAVRAGSIPYHRDPLTGRVRFLASELDEWMRRGGRSGR